MSLTAEIPPPTGSLPRLELEHRLASDDAFRHAVGEDFFSTGRQELALLRGLGLQDGHFVIDVGCGAGRLGYQLAPLGEIRYLGCDISAELLALAGALTTSSNVRFALCDGATLQTDGAKADFVCFFSVFEHLHYEDIFKYLLEATARLKPGGLVVMTFFEFRVDSHWRSFAAGVESPSDHLNQFIDRDAIAAWAAHAGLEVQRITPGGAGRSLAILQKRRQHVGADEYPGEGPAVASAQPTFPLRMANTSSRVFVGQGDQAFVQGLILRGEGTRCYLVRAIGPSLKQYNITEAATALELALIDARGRPIASARGWDPAMAKTFALAGAFALTESSGDAALVVTLSAGDYTVSVSTEHAGTVLVEVYELPV